MSRDRTDAATDAFDLLSSEIRVGILAELATALRTDPEAPTVPFSDLRRRVGVEDSGTFSYHLDQLRGRFVEERDDGYAIGHAGLDVVGAILSGRYADADARSREADGECAVCGGRLTERYADGALAIVCENDHFMLKNVLPPGVVEGRSLDGVVSLASTLTRQAVELAREGTCANCYGRVETSILDRDGPIRYAFRTTCGRCGMTYSGPLGLYVSRHPAVVSFCYERDVDLSETPPWEAGLYDATVARTGDDPEKYRVELEAGGDRLAVILDGDGEVVAVES